MLDLPENSPDPKSHCELVIYNKIWVTTSV